MTARTSFPLDVRVVAYEHPDVALLVEELQSLYAERYGVHDASPADPAEFVAPHGIFAVAYGGDGGPVAMGGWRLLSGGRAEIRRMYVREAARRRGYARELLAWLEATAHEAGATAMVLETGRPQPEAIALYRAAGYTDVEPFGYYADAELSLFLGKPLISR